MSPEQHDLQKQREANARAVDPVPYGTWGRAFRPFFLAMSVYAAAAVPWWTLAWLGVWPVPTWLAPMWWHGHEMVFGFAAAAIAGFLLTASPVWSGGPALVGRPLVTLFVLWLLGRVAFVLAGLVPAWVLAGVDAAFLPAVALAAWRTLRGSGQLRNHALVGVLLAMAAANLAMHAEALGLWAGLAGRALRFAVDGVLVVIVVIGGRITPTFTQNALRRAGSERVVHRSPGLSSLAVGSMAAVGVADLVLGRGEVTGVLALVGALAVGARSAGWQPVQTRSDPLLWSLHAGLWWVAVGLLLVGASDLGAPIPATSGLHALTAGAIGSTILAVATRVALGHTGRPLALPRGVAACYVLVHAGAVARVAAPLVPGDGHLVLLATGGLIWSAAFALYAVRYGAILVGPRVDGKPG